MIAFIYGTTGELIKMLPVLTRLRDRGIGFLNVTTGQQSEQIPGLLDSFSLPQPDVWLARGAHGRDLRANSQVPGWGGRVIGNFLKERKSIGRRLRAGPGRPLVVVHGDTMTTVLGATMGRMLRVPVAHVEAGMRSFDLRHPFPEELNRRLTSRLASIHYAPGAYAARNLRGGLIVDTGSNTIRDSLDLCRAGSALGLALPEGPFGLVSLHRFELLNNRQLFSETIAALAEHKHARRMLFVDHPVTAATIARYQLGHHFDQDCLIRIPRLVFAEFIEVERRSRFVVTDSGGSQEETYYMDIPCLIHRQKTEHPEGVGENVLVSEYRIDRLHDFLRDPSHFRRAGELPPHSPSQMIVDDLVARGFAG
ncbi:MAG: UDP-N-acetylglucosamine 2-epimerase [Candidatus Dormibacteraeota bacterium]|nr:UDP-N-acetylglucosamine 2-epimerase [Candidatus Dormibacteraeota bacterium]